VEEDEDEDGLEPPTHWLLPHVCPGLHTLQAAPMLHWMPGNSQQTASEVKQFPWLVYQLVRWVVEDRGRLANQHRPLSHPTPCSVVGFKAHHCSPGGAHAKLPSKFMQVSPDGQTTPSGQLDCLQKNPSGQEGSSELVARRTWSGTAKGARSGLAELVATSPSPHSRLTTACSVILPGL
jgi:hypothetical protein